MGTCGEFKVKKTKKPKDIKEHPIDVISVKTQKEQTQSSPPPPSEKPKTDNVPQFGIKNDEMKYSELTENNYPSKSHRFPKQDLINPAVKPKTDNVPQFGQKNDEMKYTELTEINDPSKSHRFPNQDSIKNESHNPEKKKENYIFKEENIINSYSNKCNENYKQYYDNNYDIIIDIDSIRDLNKKGWRIIYNTNENKELIQSLEKIIIAVLGNSNRGKTHILQKLSGTKLPAGYQIQTKGLSIKVYEKENLLLDTAGTNAPLLIDDYYESVKRPSQQEIHKIYSCQIITNYILQTFVTKISNVIICIVGMLTASEELFINKIKNICKNKKKLIVIHNLIKCKTNEDIVNYVENTLFQSKTFELEEAGILCFDEDHKNFFQTYFKEKANNNVIHFIYGNDEENSEEMKYYNETTLNYIKKKIRVEQKEEVNIINSLIEHTKEISSFSLTEELKTISEKSDSNLIKCEEKNIEPKRIIADEFDNLIFIGKDFEPSHRCYIQDNQFVIEIDLCSEYENLKVEKCLKEDTKEDVFIITGERKILNTEKENEILFDYVDKTETYKGFKLEVKIKKSDYGISIIKNEWKEEMKFGILIITFDVKFRRKID